MTNNDLHKINLSDKETYYIIATKNLLINTTLEETYGKTAKSLNNKNSFYEMYKPKSLEEILKSLQKPFVPEYLLFKQIKVDNQIVIAEFFTNIALYSSIFCYMDECTTDNDKKIPIIKKVNASEARKLFVKYDASELLDIAKRYTEFYKLGKRYQEKLKELEKATILELGGPQLAINK